MKGNFMDAILGNDILCNTKFLQLKQTKSPSGTPWVYAHRPNAKNVVVIAPVIHSEKGDSLAFIETRRPPVVAEGKAETCIEFPAGLVGDEFQSETTKKAIKRGLLEETGYKADKVKIVAPLVASSPGCTSETSSIAIVDILNDKIFKKPVTDGGVILDIHKVKISKVESWLRAQQKSGKAISAQTLSALYYVMARIVKLK